MDDPALTAGPGSLARGLGITTALTGTSLIDGPIWIEDHGFAVDANSIKTSSRVGVDSTMRARTQRALIVFALSISRRPTCRHDIRASEFPATQSANGWYACVIGNAMIAGRS